MYQYLPIKEQLYSPYLGQYHSFGIAAFEICNGRREQVAFISDVSADEAFAGRLAGRCTDTQLGPIHLKGAAQDCIGR